MLNGHQVSKFVEGIVDPKQIQPASVDLRIGDSYFYPEYAETLILGTPTPKPERNRVVTGMLYLSPGEFVLGTTIESVSIPLSHCAYIEGKSTLARIGLLVHITAGLIDPGFVGRITLELKNVGLNRICIPSGIAIAQLTAFKLDKPSVVGYGHPSLGSKYQNQHDVQAAK